eukprot:jgi/Hompol1/2964/HPOL_006255-RA
MASSESGYLEHRESVTRSQLPQTAAHPHSRHQLAIKQGPKSALEGSEDDLSASDLQDSEPEGMQYFRGDEDERETVSSRDDVAAALSLSGTIRPHADLIARYRGDQDILPTMIVIPKRVLEINKELAKLRAELDDISKRKDANANGAQVSKGALDSGDMAKIDKQLYYMQIGVNEEIKRLVTEKRTLEMHELDNVIMPDRTTVTLLESHITNEDGKDFAIYPIEVQRLNVDGAPSGWLVMRRYSEFLAMHNILKNRFPAIIMQYEMPSKLLTSLIKMKKYSLELRRAALEKYLQNLVRHVEICRSVEFRKFLCHPSISLLLFNADAGEQVKRSFLKNILHTVDGGFDSFRQRLRQQHAAVSLQTLAAGGDFGTAVTTSSTSPTISLQNSIVDSGSTTTTQDGLTSSAL